MKYFLFLTILCLLPFATSVAECVDDTDAITTLHVLVSQVPAEYRESGWFEISDGACVSVKWTGEVRGNPEHVTLFLDEWTQELRVPATTRTLFKNQILVHEGDQDFWLVIQGQLLPYLHEEIVAGGDVTLQLKRFGSSPGTPVVFGVQEFLAGATELTLSPSRNRTGGTARTG